MRVVREIKRRMKRGKPENHSTSRSDLTLTDSLFGTSPFWALLIALPSSCR